MTRLAFLSSAGAGAGVEVVSPLSHAAAPGIEDVSHLGKVELRGPSGAFEPAAGEELLQLSPSLALLVVDGSPVPALDRLAQAGARAYDLTAALAAFEIVGDDALRRLTELDPATFPAVGSIARGTRAIFDARGGGRYRIFVPHELGHYVAEVAADVLRGLGR
jgi:hypothetical protein